MAGLYIWHIKIFYTFLPEVADGVLDDVGPLCLNNIGNKNEKIEPKTPTKKQKCQKKDIASPMSAPALP